MFRHFFRIIRRQFTTNALLSYTRSSNYSCYNAIHNIKIFHLQLKIKFKRCDIIIMTGCSWNSEVSGKNAGLKTTSESRGIHSYHCA